MPKVPTVAPHGYSLKENYPEVWRDTLKQAKLIYGEPSLWLEHQLGSPIGTLVFDAPSAVSDQYASYSVFYYNEAIETFMRTTEVDLVPIQVTGEDTEINIPKKMFRFFEQQSEIYMAVYAEPLIENDIDFGWCFYRCHLEEAVNRKYASYFRPRFVQSPSREN